MKTKAESVLKHLQRRPASLLPLAAFVMACGGSGGSPIPAEQSEQADAVVADVAPNFKLAIDRERATTSGELAARNLDSQIAAVSEQYERTHVTSMRSRLVALLHQRVSMLGTYDDFLFLDDLTKAGVQDGDVASLQERALYLRAVHRFAEAEALLDEAEERGVAPATLATDRITIGLALGRDPDVLVAAAETAAAADPSYATQVLLAGTLAAAGRYEVADEVYRDALAGYRDSSPFVVAWNAFQRGVMWAEAADRPDLGMELYREAVRRLPGYVVAQVHLAELEADAGQGDQALSRLRKLVQGGVQDPEPNGLLAELLNGDGQAAKEAEAALDESSVRYEVLLERHPEAFADHGSEFFSSVGGDVDRGLALALFNLAKRENPRAYVVAIEAADAAGDRQAACDLTGASTRWDDRHVVLARLRRQQDCQR